MARILLVDDDEDLLFLISEYLNSRGIESQLAANAAEARLRLEETQFDAVLSDFSMPGESGLDLLGHVLSRFPGLPFIMMSGSDYSSLKAQALEMGGREFIPKPFELKEMAGILEKALGLSCQPPGKGLHFPQGMVSAVRCIPRGFGRSIRTPGNHENQRRTGLARTHGVRGARRREGSGRLSL
ncbi:MAG: response regulator [Syntrophobacteraceae bacterium]|nr:response regulator [Syntrophobacteraceae bacterium]